MAIEWVNGSNFTKIATIYDNNITLNNSCIKLIENYKWCKLGIDKKAKKIYIKLIKDILKEKNIEQSNRISIGKTYVRITNKAFINQIYEIIDKNVKNNKYLIDYDDTNKQFLIDLNNKY